MGRMSKELQKLIKFTLYYFFNISRYLVAGLRTPDGSNYRLAVSVRLAAPTGR